ncbi:hypothetical protein [Polaribacter sp. P097]|uniref:hypothetical protein n=1 Tax=Polaribacter sp. P097 TaxID=3117398 RepID=UPI002FDF87FF
MKKIIFVFAILLSFTFNAQNNPEVIDTSESFDTFIPDENGRPSQFLTRYLRNHNRLNLSRKIKNILLKPNIYSDGEYALRDSKQFGNGTTSLTNIFYDGKQIFGEGINRLYVIEFTRTDEIYSISRSSVGYDKNIQIFSKKYIKSLK